LPRIQVQYIDTFEPVRVLSDYLRINYTYQYIQQLDGDLTIKQAKETLMALKNTYDHVKGINEAIILNVIRGVKAGLL